MTKLGSQQPDRSWNRLGVIMLVLGLGAGFSPAIQAQEEIEFGGSVELRGTYDTNVLLTTDDYDFELRRLRGDEVEEEDFYASLAGDLHLRIPVNDVFENTIRYSLDADRFADLTNEHRERHRIELLPTIHLSQDADLMFEYDFEYDNRRRGAEYLRPDYLQHQAGATLSWRIGGPSEIQLGYLYENRNYRSLTGTPFDDYAGHQLRAGYRLRLAKQTRGDVEFRYSWRDYEEDTRDAFGAVIPGKDREDERAEIRLALTHMFHPNTLLRIGYQYRNHSAPGEFYDYQLHRLSGIWVQKLPWQTKLQTYLHYDWRDYRDQLAQRTLINVITGEPYQDFTDDDRGDEQFLLLVSLTKELGKGFTCGAEFQYLNNDSNDDSSEYEAERYSLFVRYRF